MGYSELHQHLVEHGLDDLEGQSIKVINQKRAEGRRMSIIGYNLLSLSTPEWEALKRFAEEQNNGK